MNQSLCFRLKRANKQFTNIAANFPPTGFSTRLNESPRKHGSRPQNECALVHRNKQPQCSPRSGVDRVRLHKILSFFEKSRRLFQPRVHLVVIHRCLRFQRHYRGLTRYIYLMILVTMAIVYLYGAKLAGHVIEWRTIFPFSILALFFPFHTKIFFHSTPPTKVLVF